MSESNQQNRNHQVLRALLQTEKVPPPENMPMHACFSAFEVTSLFFCEVCVPLGGTSDLLFLCVRPVVMFSSSNRLSQRECSAQITVNVQRDRCISRLRSFSDTILASVSGPALGSRIEVREGGCCRKEAVIKTRRSPSKGDSKVEKFLWETTNCGAKFDLFGACALDLVSFRWKCVNT